MAVRVTRRELMKVAAASGALLLARPEGARAAFLGGVSPADAATRGSKLDPTTFLAHADLHNHTLFSDGDGDASGAFASMRGAGLDVAALTDHATLQWGTSTGVCFEQQCQSLAGLDETSWETSKDLADAAYLPEQFVAIRGFEWSSPTLGHMNVWFSERWIDPLHTAGLGTGQGAAQLLHDESPIPFLSPTQVGTLEALIAAGGASGMVSMAGFYTWLAQASSTPVIGGGADGLIGFNHPGREPGRFGGFAYDGTIADRVVSVEAFNRGEDYLFEGVASGRVSPLVECLDAGWRVGLLGVTDEHGTDWGYPLDKGRTGLWLKRLDREGVREAMESRRFFSTRERGLRVDTTANGVRMGQDLPLGASGRGSATVLLDVDKGAAWVGKRLTVQVLRPGSPLPAIHRSFDVTVPGPAEPPLSFVVDGLDVADGTWMFLRLVDAERTNDRTVAPYGTERAVAYTSPWQLTADDAPTPVVPELPGGALPLAVPLLGGAVVAATWAASRRADRHDHDHGHAGDHDDEHDRLHREGVAHQH